MPSTIMRPSELGSNTTIKASSSNFTGDVYLDLVHKDEESGVMMANITFTPSARTNWHTHERGQILRVVAGSGWICDKGEEPRRLYVGDTVWAAPGTTHWHGADNGSYMTHVANSMGKTSWHEAVRDEEYAKKK